VVPIGGASDSFRNNAMPSKGSYAFASLLLGATWSCTETVGSAGVTTDRIVPEIAITADGSGLSLVDVRLRLDEDDANTFIELEGADRLQASTSDEVQALELVDTPTNTYSALLLGDERDTPVVVSLERMEPAENAPTSMVSLPSEFAITFPSMEVSRAFGTVAFVWAASELDEAAQAQVPGLDAAVLADAAAPDVSWSLNGECIQPLSGETEDDGEHAIGPGMLLVTPGAPGLDPLSAPACLVTVTVERARRGTLDPAFIRGGEIVARQIRSAVFLSLP
jgi:hypothetical protein